ncbi:hypothetical protein ACFWOG_20480 [Kitasatospora sp. NPDC058406]|uniref:hypothetical protein n=1 Tax=Kitasatospora sp. NPDC058406 TaxID=3346483 RepID=UPI003649ADCD
MTTVPPDRAGPDDDELERLCAAARQAALTDARLTAERAALWVRDLARRQAERWNGERLEVFADAVASAGGDLDPDDPEWGGVGEDVRYGLSAYVLLNPFTPGDGPELDTAEAVALAAVAALAQAFPTALVNDYADDLPLLCRLMNAAVDTGRAARPAARIGTDW